VSAAEWTRVYVDRSRGRTWVVWHNVGDHRPCDPVPCKGRQGVFALPDDVAAMLKEEG